MVRHGTAVLPSNGAVVILGDATLDGDLVVEGNRGIIYGESPLATRLDGDLELRGNETLVRGITVTGDVEFHGNKAELYHCVVLGDQYVRARGDHVKRQARCAATTCGSRIAMATSCDDEELEVVERIDCE